MRGQAMLVGLVLVFGAVGCGGGDDGDSPSVPEGSVATVGDTDVTKQQLASEVEAVARQQRGAEKSGSAVDGAQTTAERTQLEYQALSQLLREQAIEQEAADRGIEVDMAEIRRRWQAAQREQFSTERQLRRFLGRQTVADVLRQLRLQELTARIHDQVREQAEGNPERAVRTFEREFRRRWAERTACAEKYEGLGCEAEPGG